MQLGRNDKAWIQTEYDYERSRKRTWKRLTSFYDYRDLRSKSKQLP